MALSRRYFGSFPMMHFALFPYKTNLILVLFSNIGDFSLSKFYGHMCVGTHIPMQAISSRKKICIAKKRFSLEVLKDLCEIRITVR